MYSLASQGWKVTDFGFTMQGSSQRPRTTVYARGTSSYRAPELICGSSLKYTNKIDIWAVGCILYELVFRRKAFPNDYKVGQHADSGKEFDVIIGPDIIPEE